MRLLCAASNNSKNMRQRGIILTASGALFAGVASAQGGKPNILLILADDMRGSTVSILGEEPGVITPNINALSAESVLFSNAHIMGSNNGAVSMPSRAMLYTGKYLNRLEKQGARIPEEHSTLGEVLQREGYSTFHTGKWHNGHSAFNRCFEDGKSIYFGGMADHWNVPLHDYHADGVYKKGRPVLVSPRSSNEVKYESGDYLLSGKHSVEIFTDAALEFLESCEQQCAEEVQRPFFLSLSYMTPHDPRTTFQSYFDMYDVEAIELPANYMEQHPFDNGELRIRDEELLPPIRTKEGVKEQIRDYYALITHMDEAIGVVIEELKAKGLYDNTIIIFSADNGLAVGQHGLLGKQNMYQHSLRFPLMIKMADGLAAGQVNDQLCYLIDLMPTICEMTGIEVPQSVDGMSLMPIISGNGKGREELYFGYTDKQRAIYDGEWKLIEYQVNGARTTQLFNVKQDPMELVDLSGESKQRKRIAKMRSAMKRHAAETDDNSALVNSL